jgi:2-iminobutanoate/2-iminopropanoate deaminase
MSKTIVATDKAPKPWAGYSQAVKAAGLVFVSGTAPMDVNGDVVGTTTGEQTAQCLKNVSAILEAAGSSLGKVVSATVILAEEADFAAMNAEWAKWFTKDPPARQGARLPVRPKNILLTVAVIAEA